MCEKNYPLKETETLRDEYGDIITTEFVTEPDQMGSLDEEED